ncbi:hypothetical protein BJX64DRAFT_258536 [Aspergillus heterothallicus]
MAEALGAASAITTFVALAVQATTILCQTVESLKTREKLIRELREELQDLKDVLSTLRDLIGSSDIDLTALERPLKRCTGACTEFNAVIVKCTQHSSEERYSKRDWLRIRYMDDDISGFRNMLAGYKSTITIALAYVNSRTTKITKHVIEEYKELIQNTQCDLEDHMENIRTKVEALSPNGSASTTINQAELQRMEDEKQSTQKSLDICQQFLTLLDQSQPSLLRGLEGASMEPTQLHSSSERPTQSSLINAEGLNSARKEIMSWRIQLLQNLYQVDKQLPITRMDIPRPLLSKVLEAEQQTFQEEMLGTEALLEFCKHAEAEANQPRMNYYEDVTAGDNSHLAVVTTLKDLISAKRIKSGSGSKLVLGQMSDDTIQSFFTKTAVPGVYPNK